MVFRPDHRQLQRLSLAGFTGERGPPHTTPGVQPVHVSEGDAVKVSGPTQWCSSTHVQFPGPVPAFPSPLEALDRRLLQAPLLRPLWRGKGGEPRGHFSPLWISTQYLPTLSPSHCPSSPPEHPTEASRTIKLLASFVQNTLNSEMTPDLCRSPDPGPVRRSTGENGIRVVGVGEWAFPQVLDSGLHHCTKWLKV